MSVALPMRRLAGHAERIDRALVIGVLGLDIVGQVVRTQGHDVESPRLGIVAILLALGNCVPLLWRRRRPLLVLVAVGVAAVVASGAAEPGLLSQRTGLTLVVAIYSVAAWSRHRRRATAVPAVLLVVLAAGGVDEGSGVVEAGLAALAVVALPWVGGYASRSRRLYVEEVERRLVDAERDRDERARRAVIEERTHIARELHDVVAHHVSLIGVQAGAARTMLPDEADGTRAALAAIEDSSRSAVWEMRRLLDVLRADQDGPDVAPQPGLDDLDRLVEGFRAAGIDIRTTYRGDRGAVDPLLDVCCYRVVEEALTNVARHSTARRASVDVSYGADSVRISVCDPGPSHLPPPGPPRPGRGLIGMAERVALFNGTLRAQPRPAGGFEVAAELPRERRS